MKKILLCIICLMALSCLFSCGGNEKDNDDACVTCTDANSDHKCDACKKAMSTCKDEDKNHSCDICQKALSTCADADKNHICDTCSAELSTCADTDGDKLCDVCGKTLDNKKPVQLPTIDIPLG